MTQLAFRTTRYSRSEDRFIAGIYRQAVHNSGLPRLLLTNEEISQFLHRGMLQAVIAESDGARMACLFIRCAGTQPDHGIISFIGVQTAQQHRGIGRATLQHGELLLREAGCKTASLSSFTANRAAHAFYENCDWICSTPGSSSELRWFKTLCQSLPTKNAMNKPSHIMEKTPVYA